MKQMNATSEIQSAALSRRNFLQAATLGRDATLLVSMLPADHANAAGNNIALLPSYRVFRLMDDIEHYMAARGLLDKYNHIVLADAAPGADTDNYSVWNQAFLEYVGPVVDLHYTHQLIVLDHRDYAAYRATPAAPAAPDEDFSRDPAKEKKVHGEKLKKLAKLIKQQHPQLEVELLLMSLDGKVEAIA